MNGPIPRGILVLSLLALTAAWQHDSRCEEMYYYLDDGRIVITNTPSRDDVRTVPGFEERVAMAMGRDLPATPWDRTIELLARNQGLSPQLIKAVALVESGLDPRAVSSRGAMGLMQLMPETARELGVSDPFDPEQSLAGGARYLRFLLDEFDENLDLALAGYNAGPGAVRRHRGVPAYSETRSYVRKVRERLAPGRRSVASPGEPGDDPQARISWTRMPDGTLLLSN